MKLTIAIVSSSWSQVGQSVWYDSEDTLWRPGVAPPWHTPAARSHAHAARSGVTARAAAPEPRAPRPRPLQANARMSVGAPCALALCSEVETFNADLGLGGMGASCMLRAFNQWVVANAGSADQCGGVVRARAKKEGRNTQRVSRFQEPTAAY